MVQAAGYVGIGDRGRPVGQYHHRAVLTDHEVDLLVTLREEGYTYSWLAEKFEVSAMHAWRICNGRARAQFIVAFRRAKRG